MQTIEMETGELKETDQPAAPAALIERPRPAASPVGRGPALNPIIPQTMNEVYELAERIARAGWAPKAYLIDQQKPQLGYSSDKIAIAIMQGLEVGLSPMAALQGIAVINGMPTLWGDGALAVVRSSGLLEDFKEEKMVDANGKFLGYRCTALRVGQSEPIVDEFTMEDAKVAGLDKKAGPWQQYPPRMCKMRARGFVLRDGFTDAMKGMKIAEEVMDYIDMGAAEEVGKPAPKARRQITKTKAENALAGFAAPAKAAAPAAAAKPASSSSNAPAVDTAPPAEDPNDPIPAMPVAAARQFSDDGKWMPAWSWLNKTLPTLEESIRQAFVNRYASHLRAVQAHSPSYAKGVDELLSKTGVTLHAN